MCLYLRRSDYCYLTYPESDDWAKTDFPCSDECAVKFYQNAHEQPGSAYFFSYFALGTQSSYWEKTFAGGWETVVQCGDGESDVSSISKSATSTKNDMIDISSFTSSTSTKVAISTTSAPTAAMSNAAPVQSASVTASTTPTTATSGASRLKVSFCLNFWAHMNTLIIF
jgi:hypothetical protein